MKKKLSLLLAALVVLNTVSATAFAWENPLKKYNLYDDVAGYSNQEDDGTGRERGMGDYYSESLGKKLYGSDGQPAATNPDGTPVDNTSAQIQDLKNFHPEPIYERTGTRNQTLRESSRNVYSDPAEKPSWWEGPVFYAQPTLESIILKYRKSDFAGCKQECEAYVRQHPNDTLGYYYLAMCYTKCSEKDKAIRAYEQVIALNDNPMIVKYATNGRNCIMENDTEACFQNVNEPELIYPYAHLAEIELQPVDPQVLINRNLSLLRAKLSPLEVAEENKNENGENKNELHLPFGNQNDSSLDAFINAPYGNGLSPKVNQEYQQLQLKKLQQTINQGNPQEQTEEKTKMNDIKKFDKFKTDSQTIKLAYDPSAVSMDSIAKDPDYIRQQQELNELNMLLGNEKKNSDLTDLLPYMTEGDKKVSPEVIRDMMMQSMMESISI